MSGYKSKAKGYAVKVIDGKPTMVRKVTFRATLAQKKKAGKSIKIARRGVTMI